MNERAAVVHLSGLSTHPSFLENARRDAPGAFNSLVARYLEPSKAYVWFLVSARGGSSADADGVVLDAMIAIAEGMHGKQELKTKPRYRDCVKAMIIKSVKNWADRERPWYRRLFNVDMLCKSQALPDQLADQEYAAADRAYAIRAAKKAVARARRDDACLMRVLRQHPDAKGDEVAAQLRQVTGKELSVEALYQRRCRLRAVFERSLATAVASLLVEPTRERLEVEVARLRLGRILRQFLAAHPNFPAA